MQKVDFFYFFIFCLKKRRIFAAQWKAVRVVDGARLESVYTPKGYQEFESLAFRFLLKNNKVVEVVTSATLLFIIKGYVTY